MNSFEIKRCANCRWWDESGERVEKTLRDSKYDEELDEISDGLVGICLQTIFPIRDHLDKTNPDSLARAIDGSNYFAVLRTHKNFYCSQWEENEQ